MKIAVISNYSKGDARNCTSAVLKLLEKNSCIPCLYEYDYAGNYPGTDIAESAFVIAIGGDGTIIHTAKMAAGLGRPILGINAGTLGFTSGLECDEYKLIEPMLSGELELEQRLMITAELQRGGDRIELMALNDIVVSGELSKIMDYNMAVNENKPYAYRADGFIVATPTGSTAYSLSAGGPVLEPSLKCIEYTPICPHALFNRSVIFSEDTRLDVTIPEKNTGEIFVSADGEDAIRIYSGDKILFRRARHTADFIKPGGKNFYDVLNRKIVSVERG